MCKLCQYDRIRKDSLGTEEKRILGMIGSIRRRVIHDNIITAKEHSISEPALRAEWQSVHAIKEASGQKLRNDLRSLFTEQINELLKSLRDKVGVKGLAKAARKPEITPFIVQILINWAEWFTKTKESAEEGVLLSMEEGHSTGLQRVGVQGPDFTSSTPRVQVILNEILEQAARTQNTFQTIAAREIQKGLSEGQSMSGIVARVASKTEEQIGFRLDRIVQTAARGGFEFGQREAFRDSGIEQLSWLTERDPRVRTPANDDKWNHRAADGQLVGIDDPFLLTGKGGISEVLWFPGDPRGSAGNVIYCRCTIRPIS